MNSDLSTQIIVMFNRLNNKAVATAFPEPRSLANLLKKRCAPFDVGMVAARPPEMPIFATAAVEMWLRSVHSFLISASLSEASPIWSSVAGYYSSHYAVRAFAHLFGLFHLHHDKRLIQLRREGNGYVFEVIKKNAHDREHKLYWKYLAEHQELKNDPFSIQTAKIFPNPTVHIATVQITRTI